MELDKGGRSLFEALRTWRAHVSKQDGVPAIVIFHDRTLSAIAAARPKNSDALLAINGIGPAKLERYGEEVLEVVRSELG